jgi:hypothetical protein
MLREACKLVCRGALVIGLFGFPSFLVQAQVTTEKPTEEEIGIEYLVQISEMPKYMAYMVGTYERPGIKEDDIASIFDFELIYAFRKEPRGKSTARFERTGRKILSDGDGTNYDERRLKNSEHDWKNDYFSQGIVDEKKILDTLPPGQRYEPTPEFLNPLYLPLFGPNSIPGGDPSKYFKNTMPPGQMHDSAFLGDGVTLGVWIVNEPRNFVNIYRFDGKQGGMPFHTTGRLKKPRVPPLDKCDPIKNSDPFVNTTTKWKKHVKSGYWLPTEIESAEVHRYHRASYDMKIYWWIDDEVPDEIFELEDFKKAVIRRSKAHEMIETLKDSLEK